MTLEERRPPGQDYFVNSPVIPMEGVNFQPRHLAPLKLEGAFVSAVGHHDFGNEGGVIGYENEQKVGRLVSQVDFVASVTQVEPFGIEDTQHKDLVVKMVEGFPIGEVYIQVKSGYTEVASFFDLIGRELDEIDRKNKVPKTKLTESEEYRRRKEYLMRRGIICINAGRKKRGMVTDFYIRDKFMRDLEEMIAFIASNP